MGLSLFTNPLFGPGGYDVDPWARRIAANVAKLQELLQRAMFSR
jgi:hypothetical protein